MGNTINTTDFFPTLSNAFYSAAGAVQVVITNAINHSDYDPKHIENASNRLNLTLANIDGRTSNMKIKIMTLTRKALEAKNQSIQEALHFLKLKKMYEKEVEKMIKIKFSIESNLLQIESAGVLLDTVSALRETGGRIKGISKSIDVTKLEENIETFFEYKDSNNDLENILTDSFSTSSILNISDEELIAELNNLQDDGLSEAGDVAVDENSSNVQASDRIYSFPTVPAREPDVLNTGGDEKEILLAF